MDAIMNKLSAIENAASSIMEDANIQKKDYAKDMEAKTAAFDAELENQTNKKLDTLRTKLGVEMETRLAKQKADAEEALSSMEENYKFRHKAYVEELFSNMLEV